MKAYNPNKSPNTTEWLSIDESERITSVMEYHRLFQIELPNQNVHATIHSIVENQLALNEEPVRKTLERLMNQGLDRHETIHAIGAVLAEFIYSGLSTSDNPLDVKKYYARLKKLTAKRWKKGKW